MLKLQSFPTDAEAADIVKKFVNDRLIGLMEDIILDEVSWDMAMNGELSEADYNKSFEEMVDLPALMTNSDFAENVSLAYLPEGFPVEKANREFFGLYGLLKAKKEYVPDLAMEYILYHVIYGEVGQVEMINEDTEDGLFDELMDDSFFKGIEDEEYTTVLQIPEPERTKVLNAVLEQAKGECCDESPEEMAEYLMSLYEDLKEYENLCFWDTDFMLLDDMDEDEIVGSVLNKYMGIADVKEDKVISFPVDGKDGKQINVTATLNMFPWELEDE